MATLFCLFVRANLNKCWHPCPTCTVDHIGCLNTPVHCWHWVEYFSSIKPQNSIFSCVSSSRKSRQDGGSVIKSRRPVQRRMTCPSPHEISRALQSPPVHSSFRSASLDELILRCLHCFGQCPTCLYLSINKPHPT